MVLRNSSTLLVILFKVLLPVLAAQPATCPSTCSCSDENNKVTVSCTGFGINSLPSGIPYTASKLELINTSLAELSDRDFENFTRLNDLIIRNADLSRWSGQALIAVKSTLKNLEISFNRKALMFEETAVFHGFDFDMLTLAELNIQNHTFLSSIKAKHLVINGNPLADLDLRKYPNLHTLESISLQNIGLSYVEEDMFQTLTAVKYLDLSGNKIALLYGRDLQHNQQLEKLLLQRNTFRYIPTELCRFVPDLKVLNLADNVIDGIFATDLCFNALESLDLQRNRIQVFPADILPAFDVLTHLYLNGNPTHCNCEMLAFRKWAANTTHTHGIEYCHTPTYVKMISYPERLFTCRPSRITFISPNVVIRPGSGASLRCYGEGEPAPIVTWHSPGHGMYIMGPSQNRSVTRTPVALWVVHDEGVYNCTASNPAGTVSAQVKVTFGEPPTTETGSSPSASPTITSAATQTISRTDSSSTAASSVSSSVSTVSTQSAPISHTLRLQSPQSSSRHGDVTTHISTETVNMQPDLVTKPLVLYTDRGSSRDSMTSSRTSPSSPTAAFQTSIPENVRSFEQTIPQNVIYVAAGVAAWIALVVIGLVIALRMRHLRRIKKKYQVSQQTLNRSNASLEYTNYV